MNNLGSIIDKIGKHIDEKDQIREQTLRYSRTIIIHCRKAIHQIHQEQYEQAIDLINQASTVHTQLQTATANHPDIAHAGYVENATQEYVEAQCFYQIMQEEELPDPDSLNTSYASYIQGLCDVIGELRRKTLDTILEGESQQAHHYLTIMQELYEAINQFEYPSGLLPIKRKQDIARSLVEKTRGELAVASSEQRIECRTDELKGILDNLQSSESKRQLKKSKNELDIDRVW